ncbi:MAG TPA: hypothetical protein PLZ52_04100 [Bacteroidales bacterium]|nr:hypothetical protein [Bacteroidales bacterium]HQL69468.1 hypothetical protein [Bacteroidales bacterium]
MSQIDFEGFENRTMNDASIQRELVELSEPLFADYHNKMQIAIAASDFELIHAIAHKAKTGALLLGMTQIHKEYQDIEKLSLKNSLTEISNVRISQLTENFNRALLELKSYINSKK